MNLIIHDLPEIQANVLFNSKAGVDIVSCSKSLKPCIGCFGCWLKTPGSCVLQDGLENMGAKIAKCSSLLVISRCFWGGFSPEVKTVLDRSISYLHPDFQIKNGEMHHRLRYNNSIALKAFFYGDDITEDEKKTARGLVLANSVNLGAKLEKVEFFSSLEEVTI